MLSMSFVGQDLIIKMFNAEMAMFVEGTLLAQGYAVSRAFSLELLPSVRSKILDFEEIISKVPYVPSILGQLLNLTSLARINLFGPRFNSYDP